MPTPEQMVEMVFKESSQRIKQEGEENPQRHLTVTLPFQPSPGARPFLSVFHAAHTAVATAVCAHFAIAARAEGDELASEERRRILLTPLGDQSLSTLFDAKREGTVLQPVKADSVRVRVCVCVCVCDGCEVAAQYSQCATPEFHVEPCRGPLANMVFPHINASNC